MTQMARNVTMADVGFLSSSRYLIHDRDSKFCESFHRTIEAVGVVPVLCQNSAELVHENHQEFIVDVEGQTIRLPSRRRTTPSLRSAVELRLAKNADALRRISFARFSSRFSRSSSFSR